jgi:branched-subunit amino acid transport protein
MEPQSKFIIALRWLGFIPTAIAAALIISQLVWWLNQFSVWSMGYDPDGFISKLFINVMSGGAMGGAFVYAGSRIAPANRKMVAYTLGLFVVMTALIIGFLAFQQNGLDLDWWKVIYFFIAPICGAGLVVYQVTEGELDLDTHRLG